jgi:hypothetical protein
MVELFCSTFLMCFLLFYSVLLLVLAGLSIRSGLRSRLPKTSTVRAPGRSRPVAWSPESQRT